MLLRRFQRRKNGKGHAYWALVESYRTARGSRQRIISYLGELQATEQSGWVQLSHKLNGEESRQRTFFDSPVSENSADDGPVLVQLNGIRLERLPQPDGKVHLRITWRRNAAWNDWATLSEGCYLLRSNVTDLDAPTLWKHYIQLTDATL